MNRIVPSLFLILIAFQSCSQNETSVPLDVVPTVDVIPPVQVVDTFIDYQSRFILPELPEWMIFAGDTIFFDDFDIKERMERELIVNNYFHSNTFLTLKRLPRWHDQMTKILKEEKVPEDFVYLAIIESGLMNVTSPAGARGFWQLMQATAEEAGLKVNSEVDERLNLEKSTRAACDYLKKGYSKFNSWIGAAAGYNMGINGLERRQQTQMSEDFFDLYLNQETSRYVFRILAVKLIFENPLAFGFYLTPQDLYAPYQMTDIEVSSTIEDLNAWAKDQGINYKILKILNPWIVNTKLTLKEGEKYNIKIPKNTEQLRVIGG